MARLGDVCTVNPKSPRFQDELAVSFVPMPKVGENGEFDPSEIKTYQEVKKGFTYFQDDDVLFAKITPCMENGKGAIAQSLKNGIGFGSTEFHVLRPLPEYVTSKWIFYLLSWPAFRKKAEKNMTGSAGQKRVPKDFLEKYTIRIPDLSTQKRMTDTLDQIYNLISLRKQQLAKLDELIKARFVEMFGDPSNSSTKWVVSNFGEQFFITSGGTPSTSRPEFWDSGTISWIGSNMCHDSILYENDGKFISELGLEQSSAKVFEPGTVLVALVGATIGKTALLRFSTATNQNIAAIDVESNRHFTSEFVFYIVQLLYNKFQEIGSGKFKMANQGFIRDLPLICPPVDLQNKFSSLAQQIEAKKVTIQQSLNKLELLKKSLMQEYFG